ncbi:MAG: crotonase/enoyl-CoA hydratase family protein [Acidimicrobiales bacterium]
MPVERTRDNYTEVITINRPEARNAIDGATSAALASAFEELEGDDGIRAVVLTGSGDKAFSAGMDLKAFAAGEMGDITQSPGGFAGFTRRSFPKPIIAAVNGAALAGGFEMVLACDLIVAADHAVFGIPEVKRGLVAGAGGLIRLQTRLPLSVALELALTGETIGAERALELGLVNRVVPAEQLLPEALKLAATVCSNAPVAVRTSKRVMREACARPESEGWELTDQAVREVFSTQDAMEGAIAFAEKRPPSWKGR